MGYWCLLGGGFRIPSSFLRTRSTAPEQPPQLMLTLNSYVCVADMFAMGRFLVVVVVVVVVVVAKRECRACKDASLAGWAAWGEMEGKSSLL